MRIVHKCQRCEHLDTAGWDPSDQPDGAQRSRDHYEWPRPKCRQGCQGCEQECDWAPPHVSPTYMWPHEVETRLYEPGETQATVRLCACDECKALYAAEVAHA